MLGFPLDQNVNVFRLRTFWLDLFGILVYKYCLIVNKKISFPAAVVVLENSSLYICKYVLTIDVYYDMANTEIVFKM